MFYPYVFRINVRGVSIARKASSPKLEKRTARLKLTVLREPQWVRVKIGRYLGYRRRGEGVGDNSYDMEMGQAAGAGLLVGVLTGNSERGDLEPLAHHLIGSITGLGDLFDR